MKRVVAKKPAERILAPKRRFSTSNWKHLLKLVGLIVVADGKVVKEELDAYQDAMTELAVVIDPHIVMTRKMAFDWFVHNKASLVAIIDGLEYDDPLIEIFSNIRHLPQKLDVVTAMVKVAISDGVYSPKEELFIKKTILYWNVRGDDVHEKVMKQQAKKPESLIRA